MAINVAYLSYDLHIEGSVGDDTGRAGFEKWLKDNVVDYSKIATIWYGEGMRVQVVTYDA